MDRKFCDRCDVELSPNPPEIRIDDRKRPMNFSYEVCPECWDALFRCLREGKPSNPKTPKGLCPPTSSIKDPRNPQ